MNRTSPQTILITGGAGFVGSNLCDRLIQKGHRIICVDKLETGRLENVRPLLNHPRFTFIEHDVVEPIEISGSIDRIYNLACPASPVHYQRDPIATLKTNVIGALNMLTLAHDKGARILQASTSEVYGDPKVHPQPESYWGSVNPIGPRACYDEGKRCAETLFFEFHRKYGVQIKIGRIFNTYGPRMLENDGRVVSNFIVQALRGHPITIYGDGRQTRSFCYIDDLLTGLELLMESNAEFTGPCNLGNPQEMQVRDIARLVLERTNSPSRVIHHPLPTDDPKRRKPVIDCALKALNWRPRISLEAGLQATIDYFTLRLFHNDAALARQPLRSRSRPAGRRGGSAAVRFSRTRGALQTVNGEAT